MGYVHNIREIQLQYCCVPFYISQTKYMQVCLSM